MGRFGMGELLIILAIVVLLFGAKRLPELASGMGKAIKNFKRGVEGEDEVDVTPKSPQTTETPNENSVKQVTENSSSLDAERGAVEVKDAVEAEIIENKS